MRTTVDLPEPLFRRLKLRAHLDGTSLKDLLTRYVERGLHEAEPVEPHGIRTPLPLILPREGPAVPALTNPDLHRLEEEDDIERLKRSGWTIPQRD